MKPSVKEGDLIQLHGKNGTYIVCEVTAKERVPVVQLIPKPETPKELENDETKELHKQYEPFVYYGTYSKIGNMW